MAPKSVTSRRHDHRVSVLFGDLLSHAFLQHYIFNVLYLVVIELKSIPVVGMLVGL